MKQFPAILEVHPLIEVYTLACCFVRPLIKLKCFSTCTCSIIDQPFNPHVDAQRRNNRTISLFFFLWQPSCFPSMLFLLLMCKKGNILRRFTHMQLCFRGIPMTKHWSQSCGPTDIYETRSPAISFVLLKGLRWHSSSSCSN